MTAPEYADVFGVEKRYLTRWAKAGDVAGARQVGGGKKRGGVWIATRSAWDAAVKKERKPGPKPKKKDPDNP